MLRQGFDLRLGQTLSMTPQLQQAIRLLQLSSLELQEEIQQALEENPLLQLVDDNSGESVTLNDSQADSAPDNTLETFESTPDTTGMDQHDIPDELNIDANWDDIYDTRTGSNSDNNGDNAGFLENQESTSDGFKNTYYGKSV